MPKLKIFIAGHKGMVGSALVRLLQLKDVELITKDKKELDLLNQKNVQNFFENEKIDQVYLAAARVGGIYANNTYPADFIYENLMIQSNVIHNAFLNGVKKLLFLGSSCVYPKDAPQPMEEKILLTGKLEPTNEPYAIAKIAGIKMCESYNRQYSKSHSIDYRSIMPSNLYGPGDNYHPDNSHVIPALINRFHHAKIKNLSKVTIWGSGKPKREFLFVDDLAQASVYLMNLDKTIYEKYTSPMCRHVNVGSGKDLTIKQLAEIIKEVIGYKGKIDYDSSQPDGTFRKIIDSGIIHSLGFKSKVNLKDGLVAAYKDFMNR
tara:strand:+ start:1254 stop:2210 length:957 start_codon:yes stop_codon:yes gene_type:complete